MDRVDEDSSSTTTGRVAVNQPRMQNRQSSASALSLGYQTNTLPFETEREGITVVSTTLGDTLLLVVHRGAFELLALRIVSTRGSRARLAIRRHHNSAGDSNLSAFLDSELQCVIIDLLVRSRV